MPYVNFNDDKERRYVHDSKTKKRVIPRHVIRGWARDDVMLGKPNFSCPSCRVYYGLNFGREAKQGLFGEETLYCLDCIDNNPDIYPL